MRVLDFLKSQCQDHLEDRLFSDLIWWKMPKYVDDDYIADPQDMPSFMEK